MVDPVTIGGLAASALAMAGEAALKGTVGEVAKDAYKTLKVWWRSGLVGMFRHWKRPRPPRPVGP